jgi:S1-C subfamily serine protease
LKITQNQILAGLTLLIVGAAIGSGASLSYTDQRIDALEQQIESINSQSNVVYFNPDQNSISQLFRDSDQSVVSIAAYGSENAQGSGFIYSEEGHIVTNEHVVEGAERIEVSFTDGTTRNARVVGKDPYTDLAVLKVNKRDLKALELGNSSNVEVGQRAVAIGNPFGLRGSMTSGIISQKGRTLRTQGGFSTPNVLQTDAAINPGNSGGPLMNVNGNVIGVNTAIESNTGVFSGIGFAIPSNTVRRVVPELIDDGEYSHPWIGVSGIDVNQEIAEEMELENSTGFMIMEVVSGGPAEAAGLQEGNRNVTIDGAELTVGGDIITAINDQKIRGISDVLLYLARDAEVGETVQITVIRDGERMEIPLTLQSREEAPEN